MRVIKKILIVEDELLIAKVLRMQLEKLDYSVDNVVDGVQAMERVSTMSPDLIILDNFLKNNTNGIDVALELRSKANETPIIFVTGNSFVTTVENTRNVTNSFVLSKPIIFEQLLELIDQIKNV